MIAATQLVMALPQNTLVLSGVLLASIAIILILILKLRIHAFIALLIASVFVGIASGTMSLTEVGGTIVSGMGSSLGFIAAVVGLGAIFGQLVEHSGGAQSLAHGMLKIFGEKRASWAMVLTGFLISIPVFLDVGIVILAPIVYALARKTGQSLLVYGLPLAAGMAVTHAFVPPTPGPVAVAYILEVPLGQVILYGSLVGLPAAIISGPILCRYLANKIHIDPPELEPNEGEAMSLPNALAIVVILSFPVVLIIAASVVEHLVAASLPTTLDRVERSAALAEALRTASFSQQLITFLGHPVIALLLATCAALYFLGKRRGVSGAALMELSSKALGPAGIIILVTGAGGVFKGMLGASGVGQALANLLQGAGLSAVLLAWLFSTILRVAQGSATVAMLGAAALMGGIVANADFSPPQLALIVVAIAAGATGFSHVNDSGFWIISRYFRMTEKQTLQTWFFVKLPLLFLSPLTSDCIWSSPCPMQRRPNFRMAPFNSWLFF